MCVALFVLTMASLAEIEAKLAQLKQEQARERRKQRQQDSHTAKILHDAGAGNVTPRLAKQVVSELLLLLELSGFYDDTLKESAPDVVTSYVLGQGRPQQCRNHNFSDIWDQRVRANIAAGLELLYIHSDFAQVVPGENNGPDAQMTKLSKYVIEHRLFHWLVDQDCRKGVLPGADNLLKQACTFIPSMIPEHISTGLRTYFLNTASTTARHWVESYKARWNAEAAINAKGDDVQPDLRDSKVASLASIRASPCQHSGAQVSAFSCPGFDFFCIFVRFWVPVLVPFFGPKNGPSKLPP